MFITLFKNLRLLKYLWWFAPSLIVWKTSLMFVNIFINITFNVLFIQYLVSSMEKGEDFNRVLVVIFLVAVMMLISSILDSFFEKYIEPIAKKKIHKGLHNIIFEKVTKIDLEKYDNTEFYNDYIWTLNQADERVIKSFYILIDFATAILTSFGMAVIATMLDVYMLIFAVLPILISVFTSTLISRRQYKYSDEVNPISRKKEYSRRVFYLQQYAKELRTFQIKNLILENFNNSVDQDIKIWKKHSRIFIGLSIIQKNAQTLFGFILMAIYLSYRIIVQKLFLASTFIALFNAVNNLIYSISSIFNVIPQLYQNGLFAEKIFNILDYQSVIELNRGEYVEPFQQLEFKNVGFNYPTSERNVLNNINFLIRKGDKIAFVGKNGAGKTTLVKLIMRLYQSSSGEIFYNGKTLDNLNVYGYRDKIATIFQDFQLYALTLGQNILMKKLCEDDDTTVQKILEDSKLSDLRNKIHMNITKEFDQNGIVLSGGQGQKVAIARTLAKNSEIIIMDEPSSALDPLSEEEILKTIFLNHGDKTIIFISHRLSNIQNFDCIYFLDDGYITEMGSHDELMKLKGKYYEMYNTQAKKYANKEKL